MELVGKAAVQMVAYGTVRLTKPLEVRRNIVHVREVLNNLARVEFANGANILPKHVSMFIARRLLSIVQFMKDAVNAFHRRVFFRNKAGFSTFFGLVNYVAVLICCHDKILLQGKGHKHSP